MNIYLPQSYNFSHQYYKEIQSKLFKQRSQKTTISLQTMKPSQPAKKNTAPKSFGFGQAMFGIKDITMQYQHLQGGPTQPQMTKPQPQITKPQPQPNTKINIIKKQPIGTKPVVNKVEKIEMHGEKKGDVFRIGAGKQYEKYKNVELIPIENCKNVYELTLDGKESHWEYNVFCDGIEAKMIVPQPQISFNFQATDVKQGGLGNCYFISTLASLAHMPYILRQRIPKFKQYSGKDKSFQVNIFQSGKCIKMMVDNLFPKVFAKPVGNDISLMVLEKAYAQAYGNFDVINMGHSCDSLRDVTGAPTYYIDLKDKMKLIAELTQAFDKKYPLVIASKTVTKLQFLSPKHSFNILDYSIPDNKSNILLKLRDPRGCNCSEYPQIKPLPQQQSSNGIFWIDYKILVDNFEVITTAHIKKGNKYIYKTYKNRQLVNGQVCMHFRVKDKAQYTISCHQRHKKFYDQKFCYKMVRVMVARVESGDGKIRPVQVIGSDFKTQQVCSISCQLQPGQYLLFSKLGTGNPTFPQSQQPLLTISFYTSISAISSLSFSSITGNIHISDFLTLYIQNHLQQFKESISDKKLQRYFGALYGYMCMYYENHSGKSVIEELDYDAQNIKIGQKKISLQPGQHKMLMHEIGQSNNCSHKFAFKTKTVYKN